MARSFAAILIGLAVTGCGHNPPHASWVEPGRAQFAVRLADGNCLDLRKLPPRWKVASYSTTSWATFGIPGSAASVDGLKFDLQLNVGRAGDAGLEDYRDFVEVWGKPTARHPRPTPHVAAWDVPGFSAYPADDGEIVYVGQSVDALMECSRSSFGCVVHEGIDRHPVALNVGFGFDERQDAAKKLDFARRLLNELKVHC